MFACFYITTNIEVAHLVAVVTAVRSLASVQSLVNIYTALYGICYLHTVVFCYFLRLIIITSLFKYVLYIQRDMHTEMSR